MEELGFKGEISLIARYPKEEEESDVKSLQLKLVLLADPFTSKIWASAPDRVRQYQAHAFDLYGLVEDATSCAAVDGLFDALELQLGASFVHR